FATYNRANHRGEARGLTVDWLYDARDATNQNILTAQDKATIHTVFMMWANDQLNPYMHANPVGAQNSPTLVGGIYLPDAPNNYYNGHMRHHTLMSLAFDAADDPLVDNNKPATQLG